MRWPGHAACTENFIIKYEGKRPLGRLHHIWEVNIKMYCEDVDWTSLA
jgi:hypothetical protein